MQKEERLLAVFIALCGTAYLRSNAQGAIAATEPQKRVSVSTCSKRGFCVSAAEERLANAISERPYYQSRKTLIRAGWKPFKAKCSGGGSAIDGCKDRPEIEYCMGGWPAYCTLIFVKGEKRMFIDTQYGTPGARDRDSWVVSVSYGPLK